jgi:hypothetical protein
VKFGVVYNVLVAHQMLFGLETFANVNKDFIIYQENVKVVQKEAIGMEGLALVAELIHIGTVVLAGVTRDLIMFLVFVKNVHSEQYLMVKYVQLLANQEKFGMEKDANHNVKE